MIFPQFHFKIGEMPETFNVSQLAYAILASTRTEAIQKMKDSIPSTPSTPLKGRFQLYDEHFLCAIMSIVHNWTEKKTSKFFMEDIYTDDLNYFMEEYDRFVLARQSDFFFKSNVANIAKLLQLYQERGFDTYFQTHSSQSGLKVLNVDHIWQEFQKEKLSLVKVLIKAYGSCQYRDVIAVYSAYLTFYNNAIGTGLTDLNIDFYTGDRDIQAHPMKHIIRVITEEAGYFTYLSCVHCAEYRQARFYMTHIIEGYIGLQGLHGDAIISTIGSIAHDFYFHGNLERIKNAGATPGINREFILKMYRQTPKEVCQYGLYALHIIQNEHKHSEVLTCLPETFFDLFRYIKNTHLIMKRPTDKYETILGFLNWINSHKVAFQIANWDEEGRGYTIDVARQGSSLQR
jgi:hypothetical protein